MNDASFKTAPCNAVYPKKRPKSEYSIYHIRKYRYMSKISQDSSISLNSSIGINMYRNAIESMKERNIALNKMKEDQEKQNSKLMTFTPKINYHSYSRGNRNFNQAPEDSLKERYDIQQKSLEKKKAEKEKEIKKECPFRPKISEKSNEMARRARSCRGKSEVNSEINGNSLNNSCVFEALYNDMKNSSTKSLLAPKLCTFHPIISNWDYTSKREYISQPVSQRLLNSNKAKEEQLKKMRERKMFLESNFDETTGQKLHNPVVSRGPKKPHRDNAKSIYESLYKESYSKNKKLKDEEKAKNRMNTMANGRLNMTAFTQNERNEIKNYSISNSIQLLEKGKKTKCEEIFKLLDPDSCGKISKNHIQLDCNSIIMKCYFK